MNFIEQLQQIPDWRKQKGKRHPLWLVLLLIVLGTMTGYWGYRPLADFTQTHRQTLIELLSLPEDVQLPSYSTFRRILHSFEFRKLGELFNQWASEVVAPEAGSWLAVDGKSIKSTVTNYPPSYQNFVSIVSVFSHMEGSVVQLQPMENLHISEINVVEQLVAHLAGKQVVFSLDALHCQKKLCN